MRARTASVICIALASVLLFAGILAGFVARNVLDSRTFAAHVDAMRRNPAVATQLGAAITRQVLVADPDLVAVRPLVEAAATSLVTSDAFTPVVTATAEQAHAYLTQSSPSQVTVRLADIGSILGGVLPVLAPSASEAIPPGLDVTLANVGSQSSAARTIRVAHVLSVLAWLLPLLALAAFGLGILLARDRLRAAFRTGVGVSLAGVCVGLVWLVLSILVSRADTSTLNGALVVAGWDQLAHDLWWTAAITVAVGALIAAAAQGRIPEIDLGRVSARVWAFVVRQPERPWARAAHAVGLLALGALIVLRPDFSMRTLVLLAGWVVLFTGVGELAVLAGAHRVVHDDEARARRARARIRWVNAGVLTVAVLLLAGLVVFQAVPSIHRAAVARDESRACNGYVALCDRPYNKVAFPASHNAMSAADQPGWFLPEQPTGLVGQLDAGIQTLLIDSWYGQPTQNKAFTITAPRSFQEALAQARDAFGQSVVDSALRLRDSFGTPTGPPVPYMCHGLCETGATPLEPALAGVRDWMTTHPRTVLTIVIEDNVTPADTASVIRQAGLMPFIYTAKRGEPWPTLGAMIDSGHRLVVMMERHGGGAANPWLLSAFKWVQDTSYTNPTLGSLSCDLNRGSASDPLFMINNWLSSFTALVTDARKANAYGQLLPYAERCERQRGQIPNFVAVNWFNQGDLFKVVDALNHVR